ncbi:MAG: hypothetical protein JNK75_09800 [Betaproteobacteria bacterium]|nr:hypothetical protein [Betaproteobacteria bacterium]
MASIAPNGAVLERRGVPGTITASHWAGDQSLWIATPEQIVGLRQSGTFTYPLESTQALAFDPVRGQLWRIADGVLERHATDARAAPSDRIAGGVRAFTLDVETRTAWIFDTEGLARVSAGSNGEWNLARIQAGPTNAEGVALQFDHATRTVRLHSGGQSQVFDEQGAVLRTAALRSDGEAPTAEPPVAPFTHLPTAQWGTDEPLTIATGSLCAGHPCDLGPEWRARYRIEVKRDGRPVAATFDALNGIVTVPAASPVGELTVQVADAFGHSTPVLVRAGMVSQSASGANGKSPSAPRRKQNAPAFCVASPRIDTGTFTPFAALERLEVRSGKLGAADWEWGLGVNTQQSGKFVNAHLNWVNGRDYRWTVTYDGAGNATMTVFDGAAQVFTRTFTPTAPAAMRAGNAVKLYVKSTAGIGAGNSIRVDVTEINGVPMAGGIGTAGDNTFSEASLVYALNAATGFTIGGTVRMNFTGSYPPTGSRLNFMLNAGNIECATGNQPPVVAFEEISDGGTAYVSYSGDATLEFQVRATDPDNGIARIEVTTAPGTPFESVFVQENSPVLYADLLDLPLGTWQIRAVATDTHGAQTEKTISITLANDPVDEPFMSVWNAMNAALRAGNIEQASTYLTSAARQRYYPVFEALLSDMPSIIDSYSRPVRMIADGEMGEYAVMRYIESENDTEVYLVYFVKAPDGRWLIETM